MDGWPTAVSDDAGLGREPGWPIGVILVILCLLAFWVVVILGIANLV
jgi:hypothetical protein